MTYRTLGNMAGLEVSVLKVFGKVSSSIRTAAKL